MKSLKLLIFTCIIIFSLISCASKQHLSVKNIVGEWTLKSITTELNSDVRTLNDLDHLSKEYRRDGTFENRLDNTVTNAGRFEIMNNLIKEHVSLHINQQMNLSGTTVDLDAKLLNRNELQYSYKLPNGAFVTELWKRREKGN